MHTAMVGYERCGRLPRACARGDLKKIVGMVLITIITVIEDWTNNVSCARLIYCMLGWYCLGVLIRIILF